MSPCQGTTIQFEQKLLEASYSVSFIECLCLGVSSVSVLIVIRVFCISQCLMLIDSGLGACICFVMSGCVCLVVCCVRLCLLVSNMG